MEEIKYYEENFVTNKLQQNLLANFFSKYFGSTETFYSCDKRHYIVLLLIMRKYLIKNNFNVLPYILTGKVKNINEKSTLNKKSLLKVIESVEYNDLIHEKYKFTENNIKESSGIIIKLLANIMNNKFLFNEYNNEEINNEEIRISNNDILAEEILRFVELI
jgi:hypothetical protein